jgi:hypothetical protein
MEKKRKTNAELGAERARARENSRWMRQLLERAEADLPPEQRRPAGASNSEWLRLLAERGKADLEAR